MRAPLKLGITGLGTVGAGLVRLLTDNREHLTIALGREKFGSVDHGSTALGAPGRVLAESSEGVFDSAAGSSFCHHRLLAVAHSSEPGWA